jgi:hypothetical protein
MAISVGLLTPITCSEGTRVGVGVGVVGVGVVGVGVVGVGVVGVGVVGIGGPCFEQEQGGGNYGWCLPVGEWERGGIHGGDSRLERPNGCYILGRS